jgi:hypothetical protein
MYKISFKMIYKMGEMGEMGIEKVIKKNKKIKLYIE